MRGPCTAIRSSRLEQVTPPGCGCPGRHRNSPLPQCTCSHACTRVRTPARPSPGTSHSSLAATVQHPGSPTCVWCCRWCRCAVSRGAVLGQLVTSEPQSSAGRAPGEKLKGPTGSRTCRPVGSHAPPALDPALDPAPPGSSLGLCRAGRGQPHREAMAAPCLVTPCGRRFGVKHEACTKVSHLDVQKNS